MYYKCTSFVPIQLTSFKYTNQNKREKLVYKGCVPLCKYCELHLIMTPHDSCVTKSIKMLLQSDTDGFLTNDHLSTHIIIFSEVASLGTCNSIRFTVPTFQYSLTVLRIHGICHVYYVFIVLTVNIKMWPVFAENNGACP